MTGRLYLLLTSPRVGTGLLTREAWQVLDSADVVLGHEGEPQVEALRDSGVTVVVPPDSAATFLGRDLVTRAAAGAQEAALVAQRRSAHGSQHRDSTPLDGVGHEGPAIRLGSRQRREQPAGFNRA